MQEIIKNHLEAYENKTGGLSCIKRDNPDYQAILTYGYAAIPILLKNIDDYGWCVIFLLKDITKHSPALKEDAGNYTKINAAWKKWGVENGHL